LLLAGLKYELTYSAIVESSCGTAISKKRWPSVIDLCAVLSCFAGSVDYMSLSVSTTYVIMTA